MAKDTYYNHLYEDYEQSQAKLDLLINEIASLRKEHKEEIKSLTKEFKKEKSELKDTINNLTKELAKANKKNEKLLEEIERLKNQNNKNSSNSSKPSSTNFTTPKKSGANLYSLRVSSGKKQGGQIGHIGYNLNKEHVERLINDNKIKTKEIVHIIKGNSSKNDIVKYKIGLEITPYVEKHIFKYDENSKEKMPKEFYTDVTYDNSIKSLSIELGAYNVISYDRLADFFNVISNGLITISKSNLVNFLYEFSSKSTTIINKLEKELIDSTIIYTDETGTKFNGKNMYVRNYSNDNTVLYKAHRSKGHNPIKDDDILTRFYGGIMGDHDTTLLSYGAKNYECNIHLGRYLEELIQNIPDILWPKKMKEFLFRVNETRKFAKIYSLNNFDELKVEEYLNEYKDILELAQKENKEIKSSFYKEKAKKLYNRLIKYKNNHLYFVKDFNVPFDNNLSEQDLRVFKTKTKISGGFRSMKAAEHYVNALSIIKTSIKRNINPFKSITEIFREEELFQA